MTEQPVRQHQRAGRNAGLPEEMVEHPAQAVDPRPCQRLAHEILRLLFLPGLFPAAAEAASAALILASSSGLIFAVPKAASTRSWADPPKTRSAKVLSMLCCVLPR